MKLPFLKSRKAANIKNFEAGRNTRRMKGFAATRAAINEQVKCFGAEVRARSRHLSLNNPHAASAKKTFVSQMIGKGIKPSSLVDDTDLKKNIHSAFQEWSEECDADGLTDFNGLQSIAANEMFDTGECFIRFRERRPQDGLSVPLQLQILPSEMLDLNKTENSNTGRRIESGIEFDAIGRKVAYHFFKSHPGAQLATSETTPVPASEILHMFEPIQAGQIRGVPHSLSAIITLAILDAYEDAELERKRTAALFGAFVTSPSPETTGHLLEDEGVDTTTVDNGFGLEPGLVVNLLPGEDVKFSDPADVGSSYEAFLYRQLLKVSSGYGVPYQSMTGDLRSASFANARTGLIDFRRRIEAMQHSVMIHQFCKPIWKRWFAEAVMAGTIPINMAEFTADRKTVSAVKWIPPRWEWIDPLKDRQAEKLAVDNGWKSRGDVIVAEGGDPDETDIRIAEDRDRAEDLDLEFPLGEMSQPDAEPDDVEPAEQREVPSAPDEV